jgi:K(+)-stimulated pyrophosphate-energized sodium pump
LTDFLSDYGVVVALICAGLAIAYGLLTPRSLLALSPGNETMQGLSAAVQEGASAYLRRQYTTIGLVGVVLFVALIFLQGTDDIAVAIGFAIALWLSGGEAEKGHADSFRAQRLLGT